MIPRHTLASAIEKLEVERLSVDIYDLCLTNISAFDWQHIRIKP